MEGQLEYGTVLESDSGYRYKIISLLGAGGQGEVYEVETDGGRHFALKWYFPHMATEDQKEILLNLIRKGAPDDSFLWPLDFIRDVKKETFGYIMMIRPAKYRSIIDVMKRRAEPSYGALCRAAWNLISGYRKIHNMGLCYRDISFGNVFLDPDNGNIMICDNDNVSANGDANCTVFGTPRFMAPEIVTGQALPSRNTDLYSLAVLLFYMFMLGHPLDGKLESDIKCLDIQAMNRLYGTSPVFVYDPDNETNRPVAGYHDNVIECWGIYPQRLRDLFIRSFTVGLKQPNRRVTENQWLDVMAEMMAGIIICPKCGQAEIFHDEEKRQQKAAQLCWNCRKQISFPISMTCGKIRLFFDSDLKLYSHHIRGDYDMTTVVGRVVQNPNNPSLSGLRNETGECWTYIRRDGKQVPVPPEKSAAIIAGAKIDFGTCVGIFED